MSIYQLIKDVQSEVQERADELKESIYPSDLLSELADSHIPVYFQELAECLANDPTLAFVSDPGLIDPSYGVYQTIQASIYERLIQAANEAFENLPDNQEKEFIDLVSVVANICSPALPYM